jgi:hypothetical protein
MSPSYLFEYEASEELSARAADAFLRSRRGQAPLDAKFWKAIGVLLLCTFVAAAVYALCSLAALSIAFRLIPALFLGLFGGVLSLVAVLVPASRAIERVSSWFIRRRLQAGIPDSLDRTVRWTFTSEGFQVRVAEKHRKTPWSAIRRFVPDSEFWFFGVQDGPELVLPVDNLPNEVKELICAKTAHLVSEIPRASAVVRANVAISPERRHESFQPAPIATAAIQPSTGRPTRGPITDPGLSHRRSRSGRLLIVTGAIAATLFVLQQNHMTDLDPPTENLVILGAVAVGAGFAILLLVRRALPSRQR